MFSHFTQYASSQHRGRLARRQKPNVLSSRSMRRFRPLLEPFEGRQLLALVISPTFASSITSDPNAATIEATINAAIRAYQSSFSNSITVKITFQEGGSLGGNSTFVNTVSYSSYRAALVAHATTADDATALASLPAGPNNPVNNGTNVMLTTANLRALGLPGGEIASDCTITLNTSICNLDRTSFQDPTKFDLLAVTCHEIDEALAFGSALDNLSNGTAAPATIRADDLYRYVSSGTTRSYDAASTTKASFSIDGGVTDLAQFNQTQGGDFGDWQSLGAHTPQVQDAFCTPGATPNLGIELRRLDVLGYTRIATAAPVVSAPVPQAGVGGVSKAFDLGNFSDPDTGPWNVRVAWGDGTPDTTFFAANPGALGTRTHTYAVGGSYAPQVTITDFTNQSDLKTFSVNVTNPAVVATGGRSISSVARASTGPVLLATFTDPGGPEDVINYLADINWGDGTGTQVGVGSITWNGSTFEVRGSHTYDEESAADHPGSNPYQITVTIHHRATTPQTVTSTATVSAPAVVATGGLTFTATEGVPSGVQTVATFTDPGGSGPLSGYKALIDWGDGTAPSVGTITLDGGTYKVLGSHTYAVGQGLPDDFGNTFSDATAPLFRRAITVRISHVSASPTQVASTAAISIAPGTAHLAGGNLIVVGTTGDDHISVNPVRKTGAVSVSLNSTILGRYTLGVGGRIIVDGLAGDDDIDVAGGIALPSVLYGGPGNDRIRGGNGPSILVGGEGDDNLTGGNSNDLLIGDEGADRLKGVAGNDILVAANLIDATTLAEDVVFGHLVAALNGGPMVRGEDGAIDVLTGASEDNVLYHSLQDIVRGKQKK